MKHNKIMAVATLSLICILGQPENISNNGTATKLWAQTKTQAKRQSAQTFALNFKDTEISEFLTTMGQLTGKNIVIDEKVKGKITIISSPP